MEQIWYALWLIKATVAIVCETRISEAEEHFRDAISRQQPIMESVIPSSEISSIESKL